MKSKCIFLDRDGVINEDSPNFVFKVEHFHILPGVIDALNAFKQAGYLLVVVTNQSGIAQGLYTRADMNACHQYLQESSNHLIDHFYYAPDHPTVTASLTRKPERLLFEKAIARYNIDPKISWMIGDKERDIIPANGLSIKTILISKNEEIETIADHIAADLDSAARMILNTHHYNNQ